MKKHLTAYICLVLIAGIAFCATEEAAKNKPVELDMKKISYIIGMNIGQNFKGQGIEIELDRFMKGIKDGLAGAKGEMKQEEMQKIMKDFQTEMMARMQKRRQEQGAKNLEEGKAFMAANAEKEGVKVTDSGLQYKVLTQGKGEKPKATDTVTVAYKGTLIDGTQFDSSEKVEFQVNGVIRGWTEALQLMPVGSKWRLFIPSDLAYGQRQMGRHITPNSTLIFEIELIGIKK